jgi:gamma-glutamylcyclotransferase (GGCT)/AIG2-like uncharacterized protein YtfP
MKLYFAYGSNMWREQMRKRCPDHRLLGKAVLKGYRWIISSRGFANIIKSVTDDVHGLLYEISDSDELILDRKEGVHNGSYYKHTVTVELDGIPRDCLVYIDPVEGEGSPAPGYVTRINTGVLDARLPDDYVKKYIRKFVPA